MIIRHHRVFNAVLSSIRSPSLYRMASTIHTARDPNTLSNYNNFLTTHTIVNFNIDFEKKQLTGDVLLKLKSITDGESQEILLDTSHLDVANVKVDGAASRWKLLPRFEPYGSTLKIELDAGIENEKSVNVAVRLEEAASKALP